MVNQQIGTKWTQQYKWQVVSSGFISQKMWFIWLNPTEEAQTFYVPMICVFT